MASDADVLKTWESHNKFKRVRCWLNGHKKFTNLSKSLKEYIDEDIIDDINIENQTGSNIHLTDDQYKTLNVVSNEFKKLISMIKSHSKFEERQLFPYLHQTFKDKFTQTMYHELMSDHQNHCFMESEGILTKLENILNKKEINDDFNSNVELNELYAKFEEFEKGLTEHLKLEEAYCVELWLNMNEEQYKEYKTFSIATDD